MAERAGNEPSNGDESYSERDIVLGFPSLPRNLRHIVADYVSDDKRDCIRLNLLGDQGIALCLSQHANLKLDSSWHLGCLSPEDRWGSSTDIKVDRSYLIEDYRTCLRYLSPKNSASCPTAIEILVFHLDLSSEDLSGTLDNLESALAVLHEHLNKVKHVVFAIEKHFYCCFSFKDGVDNSTGLPQPVDRLCALQQIVADLRACWETDHTKMVLLQHYIRKDVKPESEVHLSKVVILLNYLHNRDLFNAVDHNFVSNKLMWIYHLETFDDLNTIDKRLVYGCHAFHLDDSLYGPELRAPNSYQHCFNYEDNPFIEKILIKTDEWGCPMYLPTSFDALSDPAAYSALIQLTLEGNGIHIDLTQLNDGYFPCLAHLSVIGSIMVGHLDSRFVPCLKTLKIEHRNHVAPCSSPFDSQIDECTRSLIHSGRPWQLVATQHTGGWSLASYETPTPNPQEDTKDDSIDSAVPLSPMIVELLLVASAQAHVNEWKKQFKSHLFLEAAAGNHSHPLLVWGPERVQKITAFCSNDSHVHLDFKEAILGPTRILNSLTCYNLFVVLDGAELPNLQSMEMNHGWMGMSGMFPRLETLSVDSCHMDRLWELDAPLLQSFKCICLFESQLLYFSPAALPHLSFLQITSLSSNVADFPKFVVNGNELGLSRVNQVVFGTSIPSRSFDQCRVNSVLHLEISVDVFQLTTCWHNTEWQCETLTVNAYAKSTARSPSHGIPVVTVLPSLPKVRKLTVTVSNCHVFLDREMLNLTELTVPTARSLGPNLKCPALKRIRFTGKLSDIEKEMCLDPATYLAIGAQPRDVILAFHYKFHTMRWNAVPGEHAMLAFEKPLVEDDGSSVSGE